MNQRKPSMLWLYSIRGGMYKEEPEEWRNTLALLLSEDRQDFLLYQKLETTIKEKHYDKANSGKERWNFLIDWYKDTEKIQFLYIIKIQKKIYKKTGGAEKIKRTPERKEVKWKEKKDFIIINRTPAGSSTVSLWKQYRRKTGEWKYSRDFCGRTGIGVPK